MTEQTLIILKPDTVQRGLVGEIIQRIEKTTLKIVAMKMVYASKEQAGTHYADDKEWLISVGEKTLKSAEKKGIKLSRTALEQGQWVRQMLMEYITMSPSVVMVIEGHNAVAKIRMLCGGTSPQEASPGTIRGDYAIDSYMLADASDRPVQNLIHASGTVEEAKREIKIWFNENEIHTFKRVDEDLIYRKG
ncbi:MAG: nucleoside-diphosphate kinase [archaeon GW2011_AR17]|nr:MAG: nucleoside-diphosphate kinase [archaeon GW2011_AR17]MBS3154687.1 nucleoside-diphosphate kinase [Candidatus Woesearchaeota archaeon]HIH14988.1 nucleoside-diphosphate kinase [Nanoarchaeota archaeon]HIH58793.1 nucleoside-diphosphate kinase [Nanoarchaeota archaeon]HII13524.1 nucleoside-diphosphate kinase [Nanoarchaeota archaeon]